MHAATVLWIAVIVLTRALYRYVKTQQLETSKLLNHVSSVQAQEAPVKQRRKSARIFGLGVGEGSDRGEIDYRLWAVSGSLFGSCLSVGMGETWRKGEARWRNRPAVLGSFWWTKKARIAGGSGVLQGWPVMEGG